MAELQVSRKNIASLLSLSDSTNKDKLYVIPEYQRPYRWGENECDTLWTDIKNFFNEKRKNDDAPKEYFIGTIVTCTDEANKNEINIIDGQQRMTSIFLVIKYFECLGIKKQLPDLEYETRNKSTQYLNGLTIDINDVNAEPESNMLANDENIDFKFMVIRSTYSRFRITATAAL